MAFGATRRRIVVAAFLAALTLAAPAAVHADGDPASDVLFAQDIFLPLDNSVSAPLRDELTGVVRSARSEHRPVKVAVVAEAADLGAITALFDRPARYARFLGLELRFVPPGLLLVVMPGGLAVSQRGRLLQASALESIHPAAGSDGLARAAIDGVEKLVPAVSVRKRPRIAAPRRASRLFGGLTMRAAAQHAPIPVGTAAGIAIGIASALVVLGLVLIRVLPKRALTEAEEVFLARRSRYRHTLAARQAKRPRRRQ